jgi:DNA-binding transcriptional LysR family regulator
MDKYFDLFSKGGLSLDRLRNFVLIADAGGLSRAAGRDPARMSLFSKQIKELESFFGTSLTLRQGRAIRFTEAGNQLASLARAYLSGLEDFQKSCQEAPQNISIAAGNSVLEWLLLPQMKLLREALPRTRFDLNSSRTADIIQRLGDMSIDLALVRQDAVMRPLKFQRVFTMNYSLFLPRQLAKSIHADDLKSALRSIPLATSMGGKFREQLELAAAKAKWSLRIDLSCSSFTQVARAVKSGDYGGVMPSHARSEFKAGDTVEFELPFLKSYARPIVIAWNPRLAAVRPAVEKAAGIIRVLATKTA